jgi:hypothetical protein
MCSANPKRTALCRHHVHIDHHTHPDIHIEGLIGRSKHRERYRFHDDHNDHP